MEFMITDVPSFWLMLAFIVFGAAFALVLDSNNEVLLFFYVVSLIVGAYLYARYSDGLVLWPLGAMVFGFVIAAIHCILKLEQENLRKSNANINRKMVAFREVVDALVIDYSLEGREGIRSIRANTVTLDSDAKAVLEALKKHLNEVHQQPKKNVRSVRA